MILWDGGNNDTPFFQPDLWLCITDPHRAGHGTNHWPGDVNLRCADVIVVNKANTASEEKIRIMRDQAHACNPRATLLVTDSVVETSRVDAIKGNRYAWMGRRLW